MRPFAAMTLVCIAMLTSPMASAAPTGSRDTRAAARVDGGWVVGGDSGLARLDDTLAVTDRLTEMDGLPGSRVTALLPDPARRDTVWVGAEKGLAEVRLAPSGLTIRRTWSSAPVHALLQIGETLYVATWGAGLLALDGGGRRLRPVPFAADRENRDSVEKRRMTALGRHNGALLAATAGNGIYQLNGERLSRLPLALPDDTVFSLASLNRVLYAGTFAGLAMVRGRDVTVISARDVRALTVFDGMLFAGTFGQGLYRLADGRLASVSAHPRHITAFARDRSDSLTALGIGGPDGFQTMDRSARLTPAAVENAPRCADISAMVRDGEKLWVGHFDCGLGYWLDGRWHQTQDPLFERVNALALEVRGNEKWLWIATSKGLFARDTRTGDIRTFRAADGLPHNEAHAVSVLSNGSIAVGTTRGAAIIKKDGRIKPIGPKQLVPARAVWSIAEDAAGRIWLGTTIGLYRYTPSKQRAKRYSVSSGDLSDDWVTALYIDDTYVWAGTYAKGVSRIPLKADEEIATLHLGGGYINPAGLRFFRGRLFAATMSGLLRLDPDAPAPAWSKVPHAAPGEDVTAVTETGGRLIVASRRGMGRTRTETTP